MTRTSELILDALEKKEQTMYDIAVTFEKDYSVIHRVCERLFNEGKITYKRIVKNNKLVKIYSIRSRE